MFQKQGCKNSIPLTKLGCRKDSCVSLHLEIHFVMKYIAHDHSTKSTVLFCKFMQEFVCLKKHNENKGEMNLERVKWGSTVFNWRTELILSKSTFCNDQTTSESKLEIKFNRQMRSGKKKEKEKRGTAWTDVPWVLMYSCCKRRTFSAVLREKYASLTCSSWKLSLNQVYITEQNRKLDRLEAASIAFIRSLELLGPYYFESNILFFALLSLCKSTLFFYFEDFNHNVLGNIHHPNIERVGIFHWETYIMIAENRRSEYARVIDHPS